MSTEPLLGWILRAEAALVLGHVAWLRTLRLRLQIRLSTGIGNSLTGAGQERLTDLAREIGLLGRARSLCRSRSWARRLRGARLLTALGEADHEAMLPLLRDPHVAVRAQAMEWAASYVAPETLALLLDALEDPAELCRFTAQDSLLRTRSEVAGPLADYLTTHDGPGLPAALAVAEGRAHPEFLAPALRLRTHASPEIRAGATAVLGTLGGDRGVLALEEQLADPSASVRTASARAVGRLGHWAAAPALARMLRDPAYPVRRESALALRSLGGPGLLLLRRALHDPNPFAADMARQTLDLPHTVYGRITS